MFLGIHNKSSNMPVTKKTKTNSYLATFAGLWKVRNLLPSSFERNELWLLKYDCQLW